MKLLTKALAARLPALFSTEEVPLGERKAIVKFFFPAGRATWYVVEGEQDRTDKKNWRFFGWCRSPLGPDCDEWGFFDLAEIQSIEVAGLRVERDLFFKPTMMKEIWGDQQ